MCSDKKKFYIFSHVPLRFQALEDEFAYQLEEQERHYGHYLTAALGDVDGAASVASGAAASAGGSRR